MNIAHIGNAILRSAIQRNLVSFPAQVPAFMRRQSGDIQERIVQLYFVRGWPIRSICDRYCLSKAMVQKMLSEWRVRAISGGYVQDIHPEVIDILAARQEFHEEAGPQEFREERSWEAPAAAVAPAVAASAAGGDVPEAPWLMAPPPRPEPGVSVAVGGQ
jgi:hypothetical protein